MKERYYSESFLRGLAYDDNVNGNCDGMIDFTVIDCISGADVAPIVRCKDCIHYEPYRKPVEDFDGRCSVKGHETDEMEFCSYGARMDGGKTNA